MRAANAAAIRFSRTLNMKIQCSEQATRYNECVPKVTFANTGQTVEFESGKLPYDEHGKPESILDVAINFGIHLEHACGGVCACTTCHVHVTKGQENLSPPEDDELDRLDMAAD